MKNGSISEQLELQSQNFTGEKKKEIFQSSEKENNISCNLDSKQENKNSNNQQNNSGGDSLLSIFSLDMVIITMLYKQKNYRHRNGGRKRRKDVNFDFF